MKHSQDRWKGYTMHELEMHRAINAVKLEIEKERFYSRLGEIKEGATGNIASYLFKNIGTVSKGIAISSALISIGKKLYSIFRRN